MRLHRATWILRAALIAAATFAARPSDAAEGARSADVTVTRRVVVSIADRKLALLDNDRIVSIYPVAVGAPLSPSPVGRFSVINRVTNPTYYKRGKVVKPGVRNPVGTRWIGLSAKGYGIHGTDQPRSIGFAKSHGCIRLRNEDVERLFEQLRAGDIVELHAERTPEVVGLFTER
jgi:lipoprotein-anchoring transpeptidase ErfK/SrfK